MEDLLSNYGLSIKEILGYEVDKDFIDWTEKNEEYIVEKYEEAFPEVVVNNGDPNDYLDFDEVYEWAKENLYKKEDK